MRERKARHALHVVALMVLLVVLASAQVQNIIEQTGFRYATLDDVLPSAVTPSGQEAAIGIPSSWVIAANDDQAVRAGVAASWGTDCLVLADGSLVPTQANTARNCANNLVADNAQSVRPLLKRILIRQALPIITSVQPQLANIQGSELVSITGFSLGTGSDIVSVTLAGLPAVIVSQTANSVVVRTPSTPTVVSGDVVIVSTALGTSRLTNAFAFVNPGSPGGGGLPTISSVIPNSGLVAAGYPVTITGTTLGNGADITTVLVQGVSVPIISQTTTSVVVTLPANRFVEGAADVSTTSTSAGTATRTAAFAFTAMPLPQTPQIISVVPNLGPATAGYPVTINGLRLGSGNDITAVTVQGINVEIQSQTAETVVVFLPRNLFLVGAANVTTRSTSRGTAVLENAISFSRGSVSRVIALVGDQLTAPGTLTIVGVNFGTVTSVTINGTVAQLINQSSTEIVVGIPATIVIPPGTESTLSISLAMLNQGTVDLTAPIARAALKGEITSITPSSGPVAGGTIATINGITLSNGSDIFSVLLADTPADILQQNASQVIVRVRAFNGNLTLPGTGIVGLIVVRSTLVGTTVSTPATATFTYFVEGNITSVAPNSIPLPKTQSVNVTVNNVTSVVVQVINPISVSIAGFGLGSGADITAVSLAGIPAVIVSQTTNSVVVQPGAVLQTVTNSLNGSVFVSSVSHGNATLQNGFTYNAAGQVTTVVPATGVLTGGSVVTINGVNLGNGSDITLVSFNGTASVSILNQTAAFVVVVAPAAAQTGRVSITVTSLSRGVATGGINLFTFTPIPGVITSVVPNMGPSSGGTTVTISGTNLGSGTDITQVNFGGARATIVSQTATQVIVTNPPGAGMMAVEVRSTFFGNSVLNASFAYIVPAGGSTCPRGSYSFTRIAADLTNQLAPNIDSNFQNPWGLAIAPQGNPAFGLFSGSIWIVSQVTQVATVVDGRGRTQTFNGGKFTVSFGFGSRTPLAAYSFSYGDRAMPVSITMNKGSDFQVRLANGNMAPAAFIVGSLDSAIHAWHPDMANPGPATSARLMINIAGTAFTSVTMSQVLGGSPAVSTAWLLYAADLSSGDVFVFDGNFNRVNLPNNRFNDPSIPGGYAAYGVYADINEHTIYVTYAQRDPFSGDRPRNVSFGYVNAYDEYGNLLRRVVSQGNLAAPFMLTRAPPGFGPLGGSLLVGNHGDGNINGYDSDGPDGQGGNTMRVTAGDALGERINLNQCDWGNGANSQDPSTLFCARGVGELETHGLIFRYDPINC